MQWCRLEGERRMASRDLVSKAFDDWYPWGIDEDKAPLEWFRGGWQAAMRQVLHHRQIYGHEWVQAIGRPLGDCGRCGYSDAPASAHSGPR
jgi:hypothetical protein